jgi:hypothetical protein
MRDEYEKKQSRMNEIGKSLAVLRLYVMTGVVWPGMLAMAGYKHPCL